MYVLINFPKLFNWICLIPTASESCPFDFWTCVLALSPRSRGFGVRLLGTLHPIYELYRYVYIQRMISLNHMYLYSSYSNNS